MGSIKRFMVVLFALVACTNGIVVGTRPLPEGVNYFTSCAVQVQGGISVLCHSQPSEPWECETEIVETHIGQADEHVFHRISGFDPCTVVDKCTMHVTTIYDGGGFDTDEKPLKGAGLCGEPTDGGTTD